MTSVIWQTDQFLGPNPNPVTLARWDGTLSETDVKSNLESQIGNGISFPTPTVDFGTGECRFDSFTWNGDTNTVPAIAIPVGAIVYAYINDSSAGFALQLTTMEWLRLHGQVKAVY